MPQDQDPCSSATSVVVTDELAGKRKTLFTSSKLAILKKYTPSKDCDPDFELSPDDFLAMLIEFFTDTTYNGMRVHFACFLDSGVPTVPKKQGFLTVCFVPTTGPDGSVTDCTDDPRQFRYVDANGRIIADPDCSTCGPWINHYRDHRRQHLCDDGSTRTNNSAFGETNSLFYSRASIADPKAGLIKYIDCVNNTINYITGMKVEFGAFLLGNGEPDPSFQAYQYQLTLLFNLLQNGDKMSSFGSGHFFGLIETDTGVPCPPLGGCPPPPAP